MRFMVRRKVDFPEPVGPISAVIDPRRSETLMSPSTVRPEKPSVRPVAVMTSAGRAASGSSERRDASTRAVSGSTGGGPVATTDVVTRVGPVELGHLART